MEYPEYTNVDTVLVNNIGIVLVVSTSIVYFIEINNICIQFIICFSDLFSMWCIIQAVL